MAVKIRLARIGKKSVPFYRIVAIDERKKRDGTFLEDLGTYDGCGNVLVRINQEGIDAWVAKGAIQTDVVRKIIKNHKKVTATSQGQPKVIKPKVATATKAKSDEAVS